MLEHIRLSRALTSSALVLAGCTGTFDATPVLAPPGEPERPIDVAVAAPTPELPVVIGAPIVPDESRLLEGWHWEPMDEIVHYNAADIARRGRSTGTGLAVRVQPGSRDLLIMFQGGYGCSNPEICSFTANHDGFAPNVHPWCEINRLPTEPDGVTCRTTSVDPSTGVETPLRGRYMHGDIFSDAPESPFAGFNFALLPYFSADYHAGDQDLPVRMRGRDYRFRGRDNVRAYLSRLVATFPDVDRVVLTGFSAGSLGALLNFERVRAAFREVNPDVEVDVLGDSAAWLVESQDGVELGFSACLQRRVRDIWRLDRGLPAGCTDCFTSDDGRFSEALMRYLLTTYPDSEFGFLLSDSDDVIEGVARTGQVAANAEGERVACGRIDYSPTPYQLYTQYRWSGLPNAMRAFGAMLGEHDNASMLLMRSDRHVWTLDSMYDPARSTGQVLGVPAAPTTPVSIPDYVSDWLDGGY